MTPLERFHDALSSPTPARALRFVVTSLSAEGHTKASIYEMLEQLLLDLRARGDLPGTQEDLVLDLMDAVTGWCHPSARVFSEDDLP